jgi:translation initiation factor IF-2
LEKVRVYELAKELNTTSKRLIEKLAEIKITVKNHMSLLEEDEVRALYDHIGVITHDDKKPADEGVKSSPVAQPKVEAKKVPKKDTRNIPRIIRTTEIVIDTKSQDRDAKDLSGAGFLGSDITGTGRTGQRGGHRRDVIKVKDASSGLRAGFVRDDGPDYMKDTKSFLKRASKKDEADEKARQETKKEEVTSESKMTTASAETTKTARKIEGAEAVQRAKTAAADKADEGDKADKTEKPDKTDKKTKADIAREDDNRKEVAKKDDDRDTSVKQQAVKDLQEDESRKTVDDMTEVPDKSPKHVLKGSEKVQRISKDDLISIKKEGAVSKTAESRRQFSKGKDFNKDIKKDMKRVVSKDQVSGKIKKLKPHSLPLGQKQRVSEILSEDFIIDDLYLDDGIKKPKRAAKQRKDNKASKTAEQKPPKPVTTVVKIPETITVKELAEALKKTAADVIKKLMGLGLMVTVNEEIDFDTASILADEYNIVLEKEVVINEEDILFDDDDDDDENLEPRAPVVVVMGHVDHGKTSLLDAIRKSNVTEKEAGGITQHIGAYMVRTNGRKITFLDTPGHEAFTAMRARGAQVTDVAILVVAADDGVMPQTVEAINHAKAAKVAIIVAINKIDKPGANPERVKQELTEYGLVPEEWGGDVICVPVSAKHGQNIDQLLEMVILTADLMELKANPKKQAKGTIIEAKLDKSRGVIATLLVQRGTLGVGDTIVAGTTIGRIRAMIDDKGNSIKEAGPSQPVEILGMSEVPEAGEVFYAVTDEKIAKHLVEKRKQKQREEQLKSTSKVSLDELFNQIKEGQVKELNVIVKADVQGSVEAVKQSLEKLSNDEVQIKIIHGGVGAVTESDVALAQVTNAIIIGFNVRPGVNAAEAAESANVDIRLYRVIYEAIEDIETAMKGLLEPTFKEVVIGHAEVRQVFKISGIGTVGGCYVTDGKIVRNSNLRLIRDGVVIHEGKFASLKRFKDDVREVLQGFECGMSIERFNDIKEGDVIESFIVEEVQR